MDDRAVIKIRDINGERKFSLDALMEGTRSEVLIIGTADDCNIKVENPKVSPHHGCFFKQDKMWAYQDMESEAGSSVQGEKIHSTWLGNGMKLILDSKQYPDSTIIEVSVVVNSDRQLLPGEIPMNKSAGAYGYAFPRNEASFNNTGAFGGAGPNKGYGSGGSTNRFGESTEPKFGTSLNVFGLLAGILWAVLGVISVITMFKTLGELSESAKLIGGFYGFLIWCMVIGLVAETVGTIMLSVGLFSYNKGVMSKGSSVQAIGLVGMMIAFALFLLLLAGDAMAYIFNSFEAVLMVISYIFIPMSLVSQAHNFKANDNYSKIYNRYYRPIIYYGIATVLTIIAVVSISGRFGIGLNYFQLMPSSSIWQTLIWIGAVVMSGIYLHVDETPQLAARFSLGGGSRNYGMQGYGNNNNDGQYGSRGW